MCSAPDDGMSQGLCLGQIDIREHSFIQDAPRRSAPRRSASLRFAPPRFAPRRSASRRFAPLRFAPSGSPRQVRPRRFAPRRFAPCRFAPRRSCPGADLHGACPDQGGPLPGGPERGELSGAIPARGGPARGGPARGGPVPGGPVPGADLRGADLSMIRCLGLSTCPRSKALKHASIYGAEHHRPPNLERSGPLPLAFLRGVGLPDTLIEYLPSLLNQPIQFYSCFISYSAKDQEFAERLHADLQNKGVRCWFAPHDLPIGAKTWDAIDEAIRLRDKVLLILSENAIASDWVEDEVSKAFAEERERKQVMLFPIRLDDVVMQSPEPWARKLRDQRNIGDFTRWKDHDSYRKSFERVMRDLKVEQAPKS